MGDTRITRRAVLAAALAAAAITGDTAGAQLPSPRPSAPPASATPDPAPTPRPSAPPATATPNPQPTPRPGVTPTAPPAAEDAYVRLMRARLKAAHDKAASFNKDLFVGEFGVPRFDNDPDRSRYDTLLRRYLDQVDALPRVRATYWDAGRAVNYYAGNSIDGLAAYGNGADQSGINQEYAPGAVLRTKTTNPRIGLNVAGYEYPSSMTGADIAEPSYGVGNFIASDTDFDFISARGVKLIRLPFMWPRIQPVPMEPLNLNRVNDLRAMIARAQARGMTVVLDCHAYGRYTRQDGAMEQIVLTTGNTGLLSDLWTRLVTALNGTPEWAAVSGLDLMNEPFRVGSDYQPWATIVEHTAAALKAMRSPTVRVPQIIAPVHFYSGLEKFMASEYTAAFAPSADAIGVHHYWDYAPENGGNTYSGNYVASYDQELAFAPNFGSVEP